MAQRATAWIKSWSDSASHMGRLGEPDEVGQELDESVLGLGESRRETPNLSS